MTGRGHLPWGTKSYEFWTLLMVALAAVRPRSILELGSGRSTSYLAEYALKHGVPFASIEQSRAYWRRIRGGLRNSFLDPAVVHYVPVAADGWYEAERLAAIAPTRDCECLFIDGPVGVQEGLGPGRRDGARARVWLKGAAATCRLLVVDDVHRRSNLILFRDLLEGLDLTTLNLSYVPDADAENVIAMAVPHDVHRLLLDLCAELEIEVRETHELTRCTEP